MIVKSNWYPYNQVIRGLLCVSVTEFHFSKVFQKEKSVLQIQVFFQADLFWRDYGKKVYMVLKQMLFLCTDF